MISLFAIMFYTSVKPYKKGVANSLAELALYQTFVTYFGECENSSKLTYDLI